MFGRSRKRSPLNSGSTASLPRCSPRRRRARWKRWGGGDGTWRTLIQNPWGAAGYNSVAIPLAAGLLAGYGFVLSPAMVAVLISASTVVVAINAQLLRRARV